MKQPIKLKAKDESGHRVWASSGGPGAYKTQCRFSGCDDRPRFMVKSEDSGAWVER